MMHRSSTCCATWGKSSLTGRPLWPYCRKLQGPEAPGGFQEFAGLGKLHARLLEGIRLAVVALQQRLGVESVHVARPAFHEDEDDALGARGELRGLGGERVFLHRLRLVAGEQGLQSEIAEAGRAALEQGAAG